MIINFGKIKGILSLSFSLARANFKMRNEGSYLGVLWYLFDPLFLFLVIFFVFSKRIGTGIDYYPLYLLLGLMMFNFFSSATSLSAKVVSNNAGLIKSIKFPQESLVIAAVLQTTYSHLLEIIIFGLFMLGYGLNIAYLPFYLIIFCVFFIFVLGLSFILAVVGVYASDFVNVWRVIARILWFATPIFYLANGNDWFFRFNPLYYFISMARGALIYHAAPAWWVAIWLLIFSVLILAAGSMIFIKHKKRFAEKV